MIQGCLSEGGSIESRRSDGCAMADSRSTSPRPWRTRPGDRRRATHGQRHIMGAAHWRPLARHAGTVRQLEFCVRALLALEQARSVGRGVRNLGESRASGRRGTCHRFHDCAGASACSRRKRGNQNQEALGRSRGGFSTKVHLRTNAKGDPLTFDLTPGEAHEVKGRESRRRDVMRSNFQVFAPRTSRNWSGCKACSFRTDAGPSRAGPGARQDR